MRRFLTTVVLGAAVLGITAGPAQAEGPHVRARDARIDLSCRAGLADPPPEHPTGERKPVVRCRWTALGDLDFTQYRLVRIGGGGSTASERTIILQSDDPNQNTALDRAVRAGQAYTYRLVVTGEHGRPLAMSNIAVVRVGG